ncbi:uncharacterized protein LOC132277008 [Cornus florida]|uniref:uncharacterized protein LOC132277008 n=1 Tax=Cornus florida TaxID=4283 RepID=UPI00289C6CAC|nr:uncharacterized protein LOC132277008 [Cornus florida]
MEGLQKTFRTFYEDAKNGSSSSSFNKPSGVDALSTDSSRVLITRPPRQVVSLWTCSKLCAIFFVAGVVVGFTLKRRVKRWASKVLRRLKDD